MTSLWPVAASAHNRADDASLDDTFRGSINNSDIDPKTNETSAFLSNHKEPNSEQKSDNKPNKQNSKPQESETTRRKIMIVTFGRYFIEVNNIQTIVDYLPPVSTPPASPRINNRFSDTTTTTTSTQGSISHENIVCWVDIQNPTLDDMTNLQEIFDLHPLTVEDCCLKPNEAQEKWESFENYLFIVANGYKTKETDITNLTNLNLIVFANLIISVHSTGMEAIERITDRINTLNKMEKQSERKKSRWFSATNFHKMEFTNSSASFSNLATPLSTSGTSTTTTAIFRPSTSRATATSLGAFGSNWILHALLDINVDLFMTAVERIETETQVLDDLVLILGESDQSDLLRRIGAGRKRIAVLYRVLSPKKAVFEALTTRDLMLITPEVKIYLRDALDHVNIMIEKLNFTKEMLLSAHSNYLAQVSIEVAQMSNKMNNMVNKLSSIATIVLPLTLISGIWGMNVPVPGQATGLNQDDYSWFFGICATMGIIFVVMVIWFRCARLL